MKLTFPPHLPCQPATYVFPDYDEDFENEEQIAKFSLATLKWLRRAIQAGKLRYSKAKEQKILRQIEILEECLQKDP